MTGRPSKRGDVIQILNRLLEEGRIAGFSTNLFEKPSPQQPVVAVLTGWGTIPRRLSRRCTRLWQQLAPL